MLPMRKRISTIVARSPLVSNHREELPPPAGAFACTFGTCVLYCPCAKAPCIRRVVPDSRGRDTSSRERRFADCPPKLLIGFLITSIERC